MALFADLKWRQHQELNNLWKNLTTEGGAPAQYHLIKNAYMKCHNLVRRSGKNLKQEAARLPSIFKPKVFIFYHYDFSCWLRAQTYLN